MNYPLEATALKINDAKLGGKYRMSNIREFISLCYLLYVASGRKASVDYSDGQERHDKLVLKSEYISKIESLLGITNLESIINENPLLTGQFEYILVAMERIFCLGTVTFNNSSFNNSKERTGGIRYPKTIMFSTNIMLLDLILVGIDNTIKNELLINWLQNKPSANENIEKRITEFLTICSQYSLFRVRTENEEEIVYRSIGIYEQIAKSGSVSIVDCKEQAGTASIYNNVLKEALNPWLSSRKTDNITFQKDSDADEYMSMLRTSMDITRVSESDFIKNESYIVNNSNLPERNELSSLNYLAAIKTKPFLILGGFSGTGKSQKVKELAFMTCPNDELMRLRLGNTDNTPGNYCLVSVRPNWHDSSDLLGYYSSINDKYIVTDFVRFLVKAMQYEDIPFFVCLDEMNLAPVEEYFAEFLSVLESRKKVGKKILTDPLLTADWLNKKYKEYNIFDDLGLKRIGKEQSVKENQQAGLFTEVDEMEFDRMDIVEDLKKNGLRLPQNIIVIGTVNMDDTTNSFSRKVIDRAMTFETIVEEFGPEYYTVADTMTYRGKVRGNWTWILPDEVKANEALMHKPDLLKDEEKTEITNYINEVNSCLKGSPFQIAYRILNETILYYRALWVVNHGDVELGQVFDDILMQKVLPRIEGDFDKTFKPLSELKTLAERRGWKKSQEKIDFMLGRFNKDDQGGFTSFWN